MDDLEGRRGSAGRDRLRVLGGVLFLVVLRTWLAARVPILGDEAYYLYWGAHPAGGYWDQPPMIGWWEAPFVRFSVNPLWVRLPSFLGLIGTTLALWRWMRTAVDSRLLPLAAAWTRGAVKTVPAQWLPGPRELRAWTLAAGLPEADRYLLGLDPHAPDTHSPLASALMRVGIAPTLIGTRGARPALRISGRRRLLRLVENVGDAPDGPAAAAAWPRV